MHPFCVSLCDTSLLLLLLHLLLILFLLLLLLCCSSSGLVHPTAIQDSRSSPTPGWHTRQTRPDFWRAAFKVREEKLFTTHGEPPAEKRRTMRLVEAQTERPRLPDRHPSRPSLPRQPLQPGQKKMDKRVIRGGECTSLPHQLESKKPRLENPTPGANGWFLPMENCSNRLTYFISNAICLYFTQHRWYILSEVLHYAD